MPSIDLAHGSPNHIYPPIRSDDKTGSHASQKNTSPFRRVCSLAHGKNTNAAAITKLTPPTLTALDAFIPTYTFFPPRVTAIETPICRFPPLCSHALCGSRARMRSWTWLQKCAQELVDLSSTLPPPPPGPCGIDKSLLWHARGCIVRCRGRHSRRVSIEVHLSQIVSSA